MPGWFAQRIPGGVGAVMTGAALSSDDALSCGVPECRDRKGAAGGMAGVAREAGRNMVRRLGLARATLDVTGRATARRHAGVVKGGGGTGEADVTGVAGVAGGRGGDVAGVLTQRIRSGEGAVVAGGALAGDDALRGGVGKSRHGERTPRGVAGVASKVGRDVVRRLGQARSAKLMTGGAAARRDTEVIITGAHPGAGAMTGVAGRGGGGVVRRFAHGCLAVMALAALIGDNANVAESGDAP